MGENGNNGSNGERRKQLDDLDPLDRHRVMLEFIRTGSGVLNVLLALIIIALNVYNIWYR